MAQRELERTPASRLRDIAGHRLAHAPGMSPTWHAASHAGRPRVAGIGAAAAVPDEVAGAVARDSGGPPGRRSRGSYPG